MIYFDATFLVKLVIDEPGSGSLLEFVRERDDVITSSITSRIEVISALHRKHRERAITHGGMLKAHRQFFREIETGRISCIVFSRSIVERVEDAFQKLPPTIFLRAGDAIHLATASEAGFKEIYSNDRHLLAAATLFKLKGINPLAR